jgi:hypothetical protein
MKFNQWFTIATFQIAARELPKIRNELEGHVLDAIESHQQTGLSKLEAEEMAVLELGDPLEANRVMKQTYLTASDIKKVDQKISITPGWLVLLATVPIGYALYLSHTWSQRIMGLMLLPLFTEFVYLRFVARAWTTEKRYANLQWLRLFNAFVSTAAMFGLYWIYAQSADEIVRNGVGIQLGIALVMTVLTVWQFTELAVLRKLRTRA